MFEFGFWPISVIIICTFLCEYVDSTLGMGYGTTLTPIFLLMGFSPYEIVPAILLSELVSGLAAALLHHREGNVNFKPQTNEIFKMRNILRPLDYIESFKRTAPLHLKVALLLATCSIIGTVAAVFVALNIPKFWLKLYIGGLVFTMGIMIMVFLNKEFGFSWKRMTVLGLIASFNKGVSGGGYGPVVTSGQILSGVNGKSAVGITSLAEGLTCLVGVITYLLVHDNPINWNLAPYIVIGAVLSVPFSAKSVKIISTRKLKTAIALLAISLGVLTIMETIVKI